MRERISILGIPIDNVAPAAATALIDGFVGSGRPHHVVTVNPEFVMLARRQPAFARALRAADLALADGVGIVWAARLRSKTRLVERQPLRGRVTGVGMVEALSALAAEKGYGVFFLGAADGVAERVAATLQQRYPRLRVVGAFAGSPSPEAEDDIVAMVRQSGAQILFVAYGAPHQDLWIARNLGQLGVAVAMGVGGAFDFISGQVPRAPRLMQRLGLEWLYRLVRQPWRWRRMLRLPQFAVLVLLQRD